MTPKKVELWGRFYDKEKIKLIHPFYECSINLFSQNLENDIRKLEDWEIVKLKLSGKWEQFFNYEKA